MYQMREKENKQPNYKMMIFFFCLHLVLDDLVAPISIKNFVNRQVAFFLYLSRLFVCCMPEKND